MWVIVLYIILAALAMIVLNIFYDVMSALVLILALISMTIGILVGLVVAIKNTITAYWRVYGR